MGVRAVEIGGLVSVIGFGRPAFACKYFVKEKFFS